jgi:hypothetical protein
MTGPIEYWHVQMPDGSVSTMTLDDLDAAFQAGAINEQTYVLKAGESTWATLAALLGLDEPSSATPPPVVVGYPPHPQATVAPYEVAPVYSLRPVVSEVSDIDDLDFGGPAFRSSKKKKMAIAASIGGAIGVVVLVAALGSSSSASSVTAAAASPPPPAVQPVAAPAPPPPPAEATPPADRFNDTQKKALIDADKARAAQQKAKMNAAAAAAPHRSTGYKSDGKPVFHKGGNKYDPLNSSL